MHAGSGAAAQAHAGGAAAGAANSATLPPPITDRMHSTPLRLFMQTRNSVLLKKKMRLILTGSLDEIIRMLRKGFGGVTTCKQKADILREEATHVFLVDVGTDKRQYWRCNDYGGTVVLPLLSEVDVKKTLEEKAAAMEALGAFPPASAGAGKPREDVSAVEAKENATRVEAKKDAPAVEAQEGASVVDPPVVSRVPAMLSHDFNRRAGEVIGANRDLWEHNREALLIARRIAELRGEERALKRLARTGTVEELGKKLEMALFKMRRCVGARQVREQSGGTEISPDFDERALEIIRARDVLKADEGNSLYIAKKIARAQGERFALDALLTVKALRGLKLKFGWVRTRKERETERGREHPENDAVPPAPGVSVDPSLRDDAIAVLDEKPLRFAPADRGAVIGFIGRVVRVIGKEEMLCMLREARSFEEFQLNAARVVSARRDDGVNAMHSNARATRLEAQHPNDHVTRLLWRHWATRAVHRLLEEMHQYRDVYEVKTAVLGALERCGDPKAVREVLKAVRQARGPSGLIARLNALVVTKSDVALVQPEGGKKTVEQTTTREIWTPDEQDFLLELGLTANEMKLLASGNDAVRGIVLRKLDDLGRDCPDQEHASSAINLLEERFGVEGHPASVADIAGEYGIPPKDARRRVDNAMRFLSSSARSADFKGGDIFDTQIAGL